MANVTARIKIKGKQFGILVDLDSALRFRKTGQGSIENILSVDAVFSDVKKGLHASSSDLKSAFNTEDVRLAAAEIIRHGEIQLPAEYRKKEREERVKQVVDFLSRNCIDPRTGMPHTPARIQAALDEARINVDDRAVTEQIPAIIKELQVQLPIRIETKKLRIKVPAVYTGNAYGLLHGVRESEEWLSDGSLLCVVSLPAGMQSEFYDKLNKITHGTAITEDMK